MSQFQIAQTVEGIARGEAWLDQQWTAALANFDNFIYLSCVGYHQLVREWGLDTATLFISGVAELAACQCHVRSIKRSLGISNLGWDSPKMFEELYPGSPFDLRYDAAVALDAVERHMIALDWIGAMALIIFREGYPALEAQVGPDKAADALKRFAELGVKKCHWMKAARALGAALDKDDAPGG